MKTFQKNIATVSVLAVLALGLSSCSVNAGSVQDEKPAKGKPSATATPEVKIEVLGDFVTQIDADGKLITITDSLGTYSPITINPKDDSMVLDKTKHDSTIAEDGWSDEDVLSAQQWVVKFAVEQGMDSIAIDTTDGWERWKSEEASKYIAPEWMSMIGPDAKTGTNSDRPAIIFNNANSNSMPDLVRDGAREKTGDISVTDAYAMKVEETAVPALVFTLDASAIYKTTDEALLKNYMIRNPQATEEELLATSPSLLEGKVRDLPVLNFTFVYAVEKLGDSWGLIGYDNKSQGDSYDPSTVE